MRQPNKLKNVLLLKAGAVTPAVRLRVGDYDTWFSRALAAAGVHVETVHVCQGERLPSDPRDYTSVLMTGSPLSVTQPEPWMGPAADFMLEAAARGVPVLGVCFGHQLLARAHGGTVAASSKGREIGTVDIQLTAAGREDPLFEGLPERFKVQTTHGDFVTEVPRGATLLAGNAHTTTQAFAFGPNVRSVQFHPELEPDATRVVIEARAAGLEEEGLRLGHPPRTRVARLLAGLEPSAAGERILHNFLTRFSARPLTRPAVYASRRRAPTAAL